MLSRDLLIQRFRRALPAYERWARVQAEAAKRLLEAVRGVSVRWPRILEVGCGTGLFTRKAAEVLDFELYLAGDLLFDCAAGLPDRVTFVVADAESPPFRPGAFDLVVASSVLQWFRHPREGLSALTERVSPGGLLAVATFGPETLREIPGRKNPPGLLPLEAWLSFRPPDFRVLFAEKYLQELSFSRAAELLRYLKETGVAGGIPAGSPAPLRRWLSGPGPFRLTFETEIFLWERDA